MRKFGYLPSTEAALPPHYPSWGLGLGVEQVCAEGNGTMYCVDLMDTQVHVYC